MRQVEYATKPENQLFIDQVKRLQAQDDRLSNRTLSLMMGRSSSHFSTVLNGKRQLSADDYRMWHQLIWPKLSQRQAEYEQLSENALKNFITDRIGPSLTKVAEQIGSPEANVMHRIWYGASRAYLLTVYDVIKGHPLYKTMRFRAKTPMEKITIARYRQLPSEVLELTDQLSALLVPLKVVSRVLLGNPYLLSTLHRKRSLELRPETLTVLKDNIDRLRMLTRITKQQAQELPQVVKVDSLLPLAGGRSLKELNRIMEEQYQVDYLVNADGSYKQTVSRGRALTVLGLLQSGE